MITRCFYGTLSLLLFASLSSAQETTPAKPADGDAGVAPSAESAPANPPDAYAVVVPSAQALPPTHVEQTGKPLDGAAKPGVLILANEPGGKAGLSLSFDLESISDTVTPEARLQLGMVEKLPVKRPVHSTAERDVMTVYTGQGDAAKLVGSLPTKAGGSLNSYVIDITSAVNEALAKPPGQRKLQLDLRLDGKPLYYEAYGVSDGSQKPAPVLEVAPAKGWTDDWQKRLEPIATSSTVYRESCLPLAENKDAEVKLSLLYPAKKIVEVIRAATGEAYEEGRDWVLKDGTLILPVGSHVPIQIESEFFTQLTKGKDGNMKTSKVSVRLVPDTWYHNRQIAVSYEPASHDWSFAPPISSINDLPRLKKLLEAKAAVKVVLFGDSISAGGDCSGLHFVPPYQQNYGQLVGRELASHYGSDVTFLNPSRAGATSSYALVQADTQVASFKPDLAIIAYGMNDRAPERRVLHKENIEKIIDTIRNGSPDTEFIVVTPILNNPKQATGLDPVKFIRDEALKIKRPGVAFVDMTTTELDMLNHKSYLDLSGNGANHPNDFLHRIYAQRILEVLLPPQK